MNTTDNLLSIAEELFAYFKCLKDYVNILSTSSSNPIKDSLLKYWKTRKKWEFPFDAFRAKQTFYYIPFFENVQFVTLNQYQRTLSETNGTNPECPDDLVDFLTLFHTKFPKTSSQIKIIRLLTLHYDSYDKDYYFWGRLRNINNYFHFINDVNDTNNNDKTNSNDIDKKYPNLQCFISFGQILNNMILPHQIQYISSESNNLTAIDIDNMGTSDNSDNDSDENGVFKQLFAHHRNLMFFRIRAAYECKPISSISTSDFEHAEFDKLKFLMIENNISFVWNEKFINLLHQKLNPKALLFLYLTFEGMCVSPFRKASIWGKFKQKFHKTQVQNQKRRREWYLLMLFHKKKLCDCC